MTDRQFSSNVALPLSDAMRARGSERDGARPLDGAVPRMGGAEHPVIAIPFTAYIDGRQFAGRGLSLVEAQLSGLADQALEGGDRLVRLAFEFQGFSVSLTPLMRIDRVSSGQLSLRFAEPTGPHLPQLRYILNEYISGDLTTVGSVIRAGTLGGPDGAQIRRPRRGFWAWIRSAVGTVLALAAAAALLAVAWLLVDDRLFVTDFASPGRITVEGQTLRAVAAGQIAFLDPEAAEGGVVLAIAATSGETLSLAMPCDCDVVALGIREGSTVLSGEPLIRLTPPEARTVIEADMPAMDVIALSARGGAEFRLPGGAWQDAVLVSEAIPATGDDGTVPVRFTPAAPLEPGSIGGLVEMRQVRDRAAFLAAYTDRLSAFADRAAALIRSAIP